MEDNTECVAPESTSNVVSSQFTIYIYLHLHLHSKTSHNEVCFWELSRLRKATLIGVVLRYILMQSLHFQVFEAFFVCVCVLSLLASAWTSSIVPTDAPIHLWLLEDAPRVRVNCQPIVTLSFASIRRQPLSQSSTAPQRMRACLRARPLLFGCSCPLGQLHGACIPLLTDHLLLVPYRRDWASN